MTSKTPVAELPEINFPSFPVKVNDESISFSIVDVDNICLHWNKEDKEVTVPMWFWEDLIEYAIEVDAANKKYKSLKEKVNVQSK